MAPCNARVTTCEGRGGVWLRDIGLSTSAVAPREFHHRLVVWKLLEDSRRCREVWRTASGRADQSRRSPMSRDVNCQSEGAQMTPSIRRLEGAGTFWNHRDERVDE